MDVAYQRGYFNEEMNRILSDPSDDTKGFFDPNTHENLTYLQLLRRCVRDPETGFYMLQLAGKGSSVHHLSEELRRALREARVTQARATSRARASLSGSFSSTERCLRVCARTCCVATRQVGSPFMT